MPFYLKMYINLLTGRIHGTLLRYSPDHRTCGTGTVVVRARRGASMLGDDVSYVAQALIGIAFVQLFPPTLTLEA